jgi:hypothetical protein
VLGDYSSQAAGLYIVSPSVRHEPACVGLFRDFLAENLSAFSAEPFLKTYFQNV